MATQERDSTHLLNRAGEEIVSDSETEGSSQTAGEASAENIRPEENENSDGWGSYISVLKCSLVVSTASMVLGFQIGATSETLATIKRDQEISDSDVDLTAVVLHLIATGATLLAGHTSDRIGRRSTIVWMGAFFFAAPILMSFSPNNFYVVLGRMIAQVGVGYTLTIAPLYVAEISPPMSRGLFASLPQVLVNTSTIIGYGGNFLLSKINFNGWLLMLFGGAISWYLLHKAVGHLPESPRWLTMKGRLADANSVLARICKSKREAELWLGDMKEAVGIRRDCTEDVVSVQSARRSAWQTLLCYLDPFVRHMIILACLIQFFRQASGIETVLLYTPQILKKAGVDSVNKKFLWTVGVELIRTAFSILAIFLIDKHGRRRLLLISTAGMSVCLFSLGICLKISDQRGNKDIGVGYMCIASFYSGVASFSIGMGPITSVYISELFPLRLRAQGCALALAVNQGTSALMALASLLLRNKISLDEAIILYAVVAGGAWLVFYKIVIMPETQTLTLEEMGQIFGELFQRRSTARETEQRSRARETERGRFEERQTELTRQMARRDWGSSS